MLPVYVPSLGADEHSCEKYKHVFGNNEFHDVLRNIIHKTSIDLPLASLRQKAFELIKAQTVSSSGKTMSCEQWIDAHQALEKTQSLVAFLSDRQIPWSKKAYIEALTPTAKQLMISTAKLATGLTASDLPMCIIFQKNRNAFAKNIKKIYKGLPNDFSKWLSQSRDLAICWIMGFKPHGDDARPDRGLPPFTRMLVGKDLDLLTVVYGPAPKNTWKTLQEDPKTLIKNNGLWEAILEVSDAVLIDSSTDKTTNHGFIRNHWKSHAKALVPQPFFSTPQPIAWGENDVDTILHTMLTRFTDDKVFEGMCNPPGGDWSGISFLLEDCSRGLRWLSLPRVSGKNTKRPDHVFEFFNISKKPIILAVESKEKWTDIEENIGPYLINYVQNLVSSPASIERTNNKDCWRHSDCRLKTKSFTFASAVAFIETPKTDYKLIQKKSRVDVILGFAFSGEGNACDIHMVPASKTGKMITSYLQTVSWKNMVSFSEIQV